MTTGAAGGGFEIELAVSASGGGGEVVVSAEEAGGGGEGVDIAVAAFEEEMGKTAGAAVLSSAVLAGGPD